MRGSAALALVLCLFVSSCATVVDTRNADQRYIDHVDMLMGLSKWRMDGRLGISSDEGGGSVSLRWSQIRKAYDVRLTAPFGQGGAVLRSDATGVRLLASDGTEYRGESGAQLLADAFGWSVPFDQLGYWLRGIAGDSDDYGINREGLLAQVKYAQWTVKFPEYKTYYGRELPAKVHITSDRVSIRVAVDDWTF